MANVIHIPVRKAGSISPALGSIERLQHIENSLSAALFYIRQNDEPRNVHAATVKVLRAAAMLKQACSDMSTSGRT